MIIFKLKDTLWQCKMTQKELSKRTGVRLATISDLSTGKSRRIPVDVIDKICKELDCEVSDIIEYEQNISKGE